MDGQNDGQPKSSKAPIFQRGALIRHIQCVSIKIACSPLLPD